MTITTTKTVTEEATLSTPQFWKIGCISYALIDENNLYIATCFDDYHAVRNVSPSGNGSEVATFWDDSTELITEEQFFSAYSEAREATNLEPKEVIGSYAGMVTSILNVQQKEA
jgi:hypothetical protein